MDETRHSVCERLMKDNFTSSGKYFNIENMTPQSEEASHPQSKRILRIEKFVRNEEKEC